jgi:phosphoribosyl-ATP pyrophosphohydrolase/phosphoribosyl-AMP cyclohydrolase
MANILEMVKFNADGLVPAVTQDIRTDEVLMLAYMNGESLRKTIETGKVHYYSRSRQKLWLKGETSGHFQQVRSISVDCDGDTLLLKVEQTGAACHTGHRSCFFTRLDADELKGGSAKDDLTIIGAPATEQQGDGKQAESGRMENRAEGDQAVGDQTEDSLAGSEVLGDVFGVISDRKLNPKEGSYTNYLFGKGLDKILKKIGEEACEVVIASKNGSDVEIKAEIADLMYHIMVLLAERGMTLEDVYGELKKRE